MFHSSDQSFMFNAFKITSETDLLNVCRSWFPFKNANNLKWSYYENHWRQLKYIGLHFIAGFNQMHIARSKLCGVWKPRKYRFVNEIIINNWNVFAMCGFLFITPKSDIVDHHPLFQTDTIAGKYWFCVLIEIKYEL